MIIDFTSGAINQQPTALPMGVWNWSVIAAATVIATGPVDGRIRTVASIRGRIGIEPSIDGTVDVLPSVGGRIEVKP